MTDAFFQHGTLSTRYRLEGSGPKLVLIHGVGASLEAWDGVADQLRDFTILRYDLRGLGESTRVPGPYSLADFTGDLNALLEHLQWRSAHVAGHSLGGLVAQAFALEFPSRVAKLILLSTVAGRNAEERARVQERLRAVAEGVPGGHFRQSLDRWFTPEFQRANPELVEQLERRNRANDPAAYAAAYRVLAESDLAEELHRITAETLVATGEHDQGSNPRMARLINERIPGSVLKILPGLRHSILVEAPGTVARLIDDFARSTGS